MKGGFHCCVMQCPPTAPPLSPHPHLTPSQPPHLTSAPDSPPAERPTLSWYYLKSHTVLCMSSLSLSLSLSALPSSELCWRDILSLGGTVQSSADSQSSGPTATVTHFRVKVHTHTHTVWMIMCVSSFHYPQIMEKMKLEEFSQHNIKSSSLLEYKQH